MLEAAINRVRSELDLAPTSRVKNTITILEKLERHGGSWLKSMHDLVGMRIVRPMTRVEQDVLTDQVVALFADGTRPPRTIDRRTHPSSGYRAVHVVVFPDDVPVEIQIRTRWQHEWAESFEKLADLLGRGIRYGADVSATDDVEVVDEALRVAEVIDMVEQTQALRPAESRDVHETLGVRIAYLRRLVQDLADAT